MMDDREKDLSTVIRLAEAQISRTERELKCVIEQANALARGLNGLKFAVEFLREMCLDTNVVRLNEAEAMRIYTDDMRISQKTVRPEVEKILKLYPDRKFTSVEIYDMIRKEKPEIENKRDRWIGAISSTLFTLAKYKQAFRYDTGIGRMKKYQLKKTYVSDLPF